MRILNCGCKGTAPLACGAAEWVGPCLRCRLGCGDHEWPPANIFKSGVQLTHLHPLLTPTNSKQTPKEATVSCWRESGAHLFHDTHEAPHLSGSGNKGLPFCFLFSKLVIWSCVLPQIWIRVKFNYFHTAALPVSQVFNLATEDFFVLNTFKLAISVKKEEWRCHKAHSKQPVELAFSFFIFF